MRPVSVVATGFERFWLACAVREDFPLARACACAVRRGVRAVWEKPSTAPRPVSEFLHFFFVAHEIFFAVESRADPGAGHEDEKSPGGLAISQIPTQAIWCGFTVEMRRKKKPSSDCPPVADEDCRSNRTAVGLGLV